MYSYMDKGPIMHQVLRQELVASLGTAIGTNHYLTDAEITSVTIRATYAATCDADAVVKIYFSPDGLNWDTVPFDTLALTRTAGETCQRTKVINPPKFGYFKYAVYNGNDGTAKVITNVKVWVTIGFDELGVVDTYAPLGNVIQPQEVHTKDVTPGDLLARRR